MRLPKKKNRELFGRADLMLGANHIRVRCEDGVTRTGRIKGKIKKRLWIREGDLLIAKASRGTRLERIVDPLVAGEKA